MDMVGFKQNIKLSAEALLEQRYPLVPGAWFELLDAQIDCLPYVVEAPIFMHPIGGRSNAKRCLSREVIMKRPVGYQKSNHKLGAQAENRNTGFENHETSCLATFLWTEILLGATNNKLDISFTGLKRDNSLLIGRVNPFKHTTFRRGIDAMAAETLRQHKPLFSPVSLTPAAEQTPVSVTVLRLAADLAAGRSFTRGSLTPPRITLEDLFKAKEKLENKKEKPNE